MMWDNVPETGAVGGVKAAPMLTDELLAGLRAESQRAFEIRCEFIETVAKDSKLDP